MRGHSGRQINRLRCSRRWRSGCRLGEQLPQRQREARQHRAAVKRVAFVQHGGWLRTRIDRHGSSGWVHVPDEACFGR